MESKTPPIILPIIAGFIGLVAIVGTVTYYGGQKIDPQFRLSLTQTAASGISNLNEPRLFNEEEYLAALLAGKAVLLYFTAPWCPECDYAKMRLAQATSAWPSDQAEVFIVDFLPPSASSTRPEADLALRFGVLAPDTKIICVTEKCSNNHPKGGVLNVIERR